MNLFKTHMYFVYLKVIVRRFTTDTTGNGVKWVFWGSCFCFSQLRRSCFRANRFCFKTWNSLPKVSSSTLHDLPHSVGLQTRTLFFCVMKNTYGTCFNFVECRETTMKEVLMTWRTVRSPRTEVLDSTDVIVSRDHMTSILSRDHMTSNQIH